jgi:hypothetical protein
MSCLIGRLLFVSIFYMPVCRMVGMASFRDCMTRSRAGPSLAIQQKKFVLAMKWDEISPEHQLHESSGVGYL